MWRPCIAPRHKCDAFVAQVCPVWTVRENSLTLCLWDRDVFGVQMFGLVRFRAALAASVLVLSSAVAVAPQSGFAQSLSGFRQAVAETAASEDALAQFYAARDYAPIWTGAGDTARRAAFFDALDRAGHHGLPVARYDASALRARFNDLRTERDRGQLEVAMSEAFLAYARDISTGALEPARIDPGIVREIPRRAPLDLINGFVAADPVAFLRALPPAAPQYAQLMKAKLTLESTIASGGWGAPVPSAALRPGDTGPAVVALRDRLQAMGYLGRSATASFDADIQKAVQQFQLEHGLTPDGVAGDGTVAEINRAPEDRLRSVIVAMERLRWMNDVDLGQRHIWVNITDFSVRVIDHGKVTFESVTVVGQNTSDRRTPEFSDQMELMVINPTWNVPRSITVKEYLPMMQRNPNAAGHIKIIDSRGRVVPRSAINFASYSSRSFPFAMKQPPSNGNALGLVKFLFPNKYNIYLHDTPSKSLFAKEVRAFSHGCVRVQRPFELAYVLLGAQTDDPVGTFQRHLDTGRETPVQLEQPFPVHLVYFTAWPTAKGRMDYRRDIYGRDAALFGALEKAGVELRARGS